MKLDYYRFLAHQGPVVFSRGLPYARCVEYPEVVKRLALGSEDRLLDIGSRYSPLPQILAIKHGCRVTAVDPEPDFAKKQLAMAERVRAARELVRRERLEFLVRDAADLPFGDGHFTKIAAISVLEHILDERPVVEELARLLAPGGRLVVSVPYDPHRDEPRYFRKRAYVTGSDEKEEFYERYYNDQNLQDRIVGPSRLIQAELARFGEPGFNAHNLVFGNQKIPWFVRRLLFQPFAPMVAPLLIRKLEPHQFRHKSKLYTADMAVLVLEKPGSTGE